MSLLFTILAVIAAVIFIILLSLGLFVALIVLLIIGAIFFIVSFFFGSTNFEWQSISNAGDHDTLVIPQDFNQCLLGNDLDLCRTKFTHWDEKDKALIQDLSDQVKRELGKRNEDIRLRKIVTGSTQGSKSVTLEIDADFEKKENVLEYYLLVPDEDEKDKPYKIKELKWNY